MKVIEKKHISFSFGQFRIILAFSKVYFDFFDLFGNFGRSGSCGTFFELFSNFGYFLVFCDVLENLGCIGN